MRARLLRNGSDAAGAVERVIGKVTGPVRKAGFPWVAPGTPVNAVMPHDPETLGVDYDTDWARGPIARAARAVIFDGPMRLAARALAAPDIHGHDRLADLARLADRTEDGESQPVIFTPNHHSHLDTMLMVRAVPARWRRRLVVAAAADYFFDTRLKATWAALSLNAIPIDRHGAGRKSADQMAQLIADGWSLVIYPEGGRSPDGWGQPFRGGAAYLANRTGAPIVPVYLDGTDTIFPKGARRIRPGRTRVTFGDPIVATPGESTRRLNARIEAAVTMLADESSTDFWTARRRAAQGRNPRLGGPDYTGWRRQWALSGRRRAGIASWRRRPTRNWP